MRRTKIVCTIGPMSDSPEMLARLIDNGMNVARLNMSHGDYAEHGARIERLRALRQERGLPIGIMLDTKGPEIRLGRFAGGKVVLNQGDAFTLTTRDLPGDEQRVSITYKGLPGDVKPGMEILIDDGLVAMRVEDVDSQDIRCTVLNPGVVGDRKGVNVPSAHLSLPAVTAKDIEDLRFGIQMGVDFVAASFCRRAQDVLEIKTLLAANGGAGIRVIAKIENMQGVQNIDDIITVADGVMVARGDLGVEIPLEDVPSVQKRIIAKCNAAGKPVITATQMLESMITRLRPTRAEVSDVANSILDGTDAIMLSGETANGAYPAEAVAVMSRIACTTEKAAMSKREYASGHALTVTDAVSHASCAIAQDLGATAIITATKTGSTARQVSKYRPICPVYATTTTEASYLALSLQWGVTPVLCKQLTTTDELIEESVRVVQEAGFLQDGDTVVLTAGVPVGLSGTTNLIKVHIVGEVLLRGIGLCGMPAYGRAFLLDDVNRALAEFQEGDILVTSRTDNSMLPLLKKAAGVLVEDDDLLGHTATVGLTLDLPVILGLKGVTSLLKEGTYITLDPRSGCIYNGKAISLL